MKERFTVVFIFLVVLSLDVNFVWAQFNTISTCKNFYKVERVKREDNASTSNLKYSKDWDYALIKDELLNQYLSVSYPLADIKVTSNFGLRQDPISKKKRNHNGIDLKASNEEVYSMMAGKVKKTGSDKTSGNYIIIQHGDYTVSYCHLSLVLVTSSQEVKAGEVVALSGNTGRSTGPHLHVTCKFKGECIDPLIFFDYIDRVREDAKERLVLVQ